MLKPRMYALLAKCRLMKVLEEWRPGNGFVRFVFALFGQLRKREGLVVFPLVPLDDASGVDAYAAAMDEALKDDRVRNIAVAAQYGAGKSTFLRTYFRGHNVLWVSLASFVEIIKGDEEKNKGVERKIEGRLEASILQQMFYAASDCELPFSHFNRIAKVGLKRYLFVVAVLGISVASAALAYWWVFALSLIPVVMLVMDVLRRVGWSIGLRFKGVEVSMEQKADASIFNRFLDEIIYYFATLRYDAVVFEDIDRCASIELFVKLRELNIILNSARQIPLSHRPIKFVYAVRDDLLKSNEDRVKFFDAIIPIVPVLDPNNAATIFLKQLKMTGRIKEESWAKCELLVRKLAPFFKDCRLVNNIINEYSIIRTKLKSGVLLDDRLLAMVVFKNYFPAEYDNACRREGLLPYVFGEFLNSVRTRISGDANAEVVDVQKQIDAIDSVRERSVDELNVYYFINGFLAHFPSEAYSLTINGTNEIYNHSQILSPSIIPVLVGRDATFHQQQSYYTSGIRWASIEKTVSGESYTVRKEKIEARVNGHLDQLKVSLARAKERRDRQLKLSIGQIIGEGLLDVSTFKTMIGEYKPVCADAALLYALLSEGFIAEDYSNYMSQYAGSADEQGDFEYRVSVMNGVGDGVAFDIHNPERVIDELGEPYFHSHVILNHSVLRAFVESGRFLSGDDGKAAAFAEVVCSSRDGLVFLAEHFRRHTEDSYRFKVIESLAPDLLDKVTSLLTKDRRDADVIIGAGVRKLYQENAGHATLSKSVGDYLVNAPDVKEMFDLMGLDAATIKSIMACNALPFDRINVSVLGDEVARAAIDTNSYGFNYETLKHVIAFVGGDESMFETRNYSTIKNCGNEQVVKYVMEETNFLNEYIVHVYEALPVCQEEPSEVICEVVNQQFMTRSACRMFLSKQSAQIENSADIENQHAYELAFMGNHIKATWGNALELFERCCVKEVPSANESPAAVEYDSEGLKVLSSFVGKNWDALKDGRLGDSAGLELFKECVASGGVDLYPVSKNDELRKFLNIEDLADEDGAKNASAKE